jgi:hypothetical protein
VSSPISRANKRLAAVETRVAAEASASIRVLIGFALDHYGLASGNNTNNTKEYEKIAW